jgi:hypothetical protein
MVTQSLLPPAQAQGTRWKGHLHLHRRDLLSRLGHPGCCWCQKLAAVAAVVAAAQTVSAAALTALGAAEALGAVLAALGLAPARV